MLPSRADIIQKLKIEINTLNGFKQLRNSRIPNNVLGPVNKAFPYEIFPLGCLHEIRCQDALDRPAAIGFLSVVLSSFIHNGVIVWISQKEHIFPPALRKFSLDPSNIIFTHPNKSRDLLWTMEEALKCQGISAVVGEFDSMDFNISRRFQLAVEGSRVTAFILGQGSKWNGNTASTARWKISPLPSVIEAGLPGIGFPRWQVHLEKLRNGKPESWDLLYKKGTLVEYIKEEEGLVEENRKTG